MSSRETILGSIRSHLAASVPHDQLETVHDPDLSIGVSPVEVSPISTVEQFKQSLEAVDGHCVIARDEAEIAQAITRIVSDLGVRRIALSDAPVLARLINAGDVEISPPDIFEFDAGISTAQAAIAETGTLVLDCARERHRLVSLVPPVHIAILEASSIFQTLAEALAFVHQNGNISPAVTFITGPSRTADIELTLTIGVHGPQELYVIVNDAARG